MRRIAIATIVLLMAGACTAVSSYRYRGIETAHAQCTLCHISDGARELIDPVDKLCAACHLKRAMPGAEHRVGMQPKTIVARLPLYDGKVECPTCHDPHGATGNVEMLRLSPAELCQACHDK